MAGNRGDIKIIHCVFSPKFLSATPNFRHFWCGAWDKVWRKGLCVARGVQRNSKGGANIEKINCFSQIRNKMSKGGGAKDRRPPLCTPMCVALGNLDVALGKFRCGDRETWVVINS